MIRRVTEHQAKSIDREYLSVLTIYEPGINKEQVKKINKYSKKHHVLVSRQDKYEWV